MCKCVVLVEMAQYRLTKRRNNRRSIEQLTFDCLRILLVPIIKFLFGHFRGATPL